MKTINNEIPLVPENTTDPAAGLNLSLKDVDALLQAAVLSIINEPPASPAEGDRHLVEVGTGAWAGKDDLIAQFLDGAWSYYAARYIVNIDDGLLYVRNAGGWMPAIGASYLVAALPATAPEGARAFTVDGRKVGEGASAGTGVPVYYSAGQWRTYSTDAQVLA